MRIWLGGWGVNRATVNRRENGQPEPSKLAGAQLDAFCKKMASPDKSALPGAWTHHSMDIGRGRKQAEGYRHASALKKESRVAQD